MELRPVQLQLSGVVDLQPATSLEPVYVRDWLGDLAGKRVLFFNNGKMSDEYVLYRDLYPVVSGLLEGEGATCEPATRHLLRGYDEAVEELIVGELRGRRPNGVVIGVGDAGVTYLSSLLARRLVEEGWPCVLVCNDLGIGLAKTMAARSTPNLPILRIPARASQITRAALEDLGSEIASALKDGPRREETSGEVDAGRYRSLSVEGELAGADGDVARDFRPKGDATDFSDAFFELTSAGGLGDGLPLVVPTEEKLSRMLAFSPDPPETVLAAVVAPRCVDLRVRDVAVNAVMAGCRPEHFPILLAAFKAMSQRLYNLSLSAITTHPSGHMILASGPLADRVGVASGSGCLGPGYRANATIGRAARLAMINTLGAIPGEGNLSIAGSPAQYSYCFAENRAESPWPGLNEDLRGRDSTVVVVHRVEGPRDVIEHVAKEPEVILDTLAGTATSIGSNNAYRPAELMVILNPEHAWLIADRGWTKDDVKRYLFERTRNRRGDLAGRGIVADHPRWMRHLDEVPVVERPEDVWVVVAGGWGPHSLVALPWAWSRLCWEDVPAF